MLDFFWPRHNPIDFVPRTGFSLDCNDSVVADYRRIPSGSRGGPDRVARRPERYAMPRDKSVAEVKAELQRVLTSELATRKLSYPRSDGSAWTLTLRDVIDRAVDLEMAYNPNDCVELRWGAPAKSDEASTCKRYAPAAQREKMSKYRAWFHERRRPPRA